MVDLNPPEGAVRTGQMSCGVKFRGRHRPEIFVILVKDIIPAFFAELIVPFHGLFQSIPVDSCLAGQLFHRIRDEYIVVSFIKGLFNQGVEIVNLRKRKNDT